MSLMLCAQLIAQAPQGIPYQGVARNSEGLVIPNKTISLRFTFHDLTANGPVVFREIHNLKTNALGLFNCNVGNGNAILGDIDDIDWGKGAKFVQVELDATGTSSYADMGTNQLMSVPYALYAANGPRGKDGDKGKDGDGDKGNDKGTGKLFLFELSVKIFMQS